MNHKASTPYPRIGLGLSESCSRPELFRAAFRSWLARGFRIRYLDLPPSGTAMNYTSKHFESSSHAYNAMTAARLKYTHGYFKPSVVHGTMKMNTVQILVRYSISPWNRDPATVIRTNVKSLCQFRNASKSVCQVVRFHFVCFGTDKSLRLRKVLLNWALSNQVAHSVNLRHYQSRL